MLIFLDTEFTGLDQAHPDLISIGLVDEAGSEFYAELPSEHYAVQCNEWVHHHVLPHLCGGEHVQSVAIIRERLALWIAGIEDRAMIVTDCPDADFTLLKTLLPVWPQNLASDPMLFSSWSMGGEPATCARKADDELSHTRPAGPPRAPRCPCPAGWHALRA